MTRERKIREKNETSQERSHDTGMSDHVTKTMDPDEVYAAPAGRLSQGSVEPPDAILGRIQEETPLFLPGVDVTAGLRRAGGNQVLYCKLLRKCAGSHWDGERKIRLHITEGRKDEAWRMAHSIKGVAGNLGAVSLHKAAEAIEDAIVADAPELEQELRIFGERMKSFVEAVTKTIPDDKVADPYGVDTLPAGSPEELKEILLQLNEPIRMHRPKECRRVTALLSSYRWPREQADELMVLVDFLDRYQFEPAEEVRRKLLAMIAA